jgi:pimeloyl-ACP methyl ester carboxylesterase
MTSIRQRVIDLDGSTVAVREAGDVANPAFVLLHGWPQSSRAFESVIDELADDYFVLAPDLPGIGGSRAAATSGAKRALAARVARLIEVTNARSTILVGHDIGGMITFAYVREPLADIDGAVIMNTVIPGVDPWAQLIANPHIWHFGFHAVPNLPEMLVAEQQRLYFDFFYDVLAQDPTAITPEARDEYARDYGRPEALKAGFDWYRAFPRDVEHNTPPLKVDLPVLYLRGDGEQGHISTYLAGLRRSGLHRVIGHIIKGSGHFAPEEAPSEVAAVLREFRQSLAAR